MKLREASVMDLWKLAGSLPPGSSIELRMDNRPYATTPHAWVWIGSTCRSGNVALDDSIDDLPAFIAKQEHDRKLAEARAIIAAEETQEVTPAERAGLGVGNGND